jgi:hypothetical protein
MKTVLLLSAAAMVLSASAAVARPVTKAIRLDGYCNVYSITIDKGIAWVQDTPSCSGNYGGGVVGSAKNFGKSIDLALQSMSSPGVQLYLVASYPFVTGGTFKLYQTVDGNNFIDEVDGTYTLDSSPENGPKGGKSVTTAFRH